MSACPRCIELMRRIEELTGHLDDVRGDLVAATRQTAIIAGRCEAAEIRSRQLKAEMDALRDEVQYKTKNEQPAPGTDGVI